MRYNGRYALDHRDVSWTTQAKKYPFATISYQQGETKLEVSLVECETLAVPVIYFPEDATNDQIKRAKLMDTLPNTLHCLLKKVIVGKQSFGFKVVVTIQQADGSVTAAVINALYLVLTQAIAKQQMTKKHAFALIDDFAAVTLAKQEEMLVDPDAIEESKAEFLLVMVMCKDGRFIDWYNDSPEVFDIERINESFILGQRAAESLLAELMTTTQVAMPLEEKTIMIATNNQGKAKEFASLFAKAGYQIKTLADYKELPEVEETGQTFAENACLKAETIAQQLNIPVLADDSGLKVDALNGLPGVYSARFAGLQKSDAANNAKLLHELTDVADEQRTAQFHCTLAFAAPERETLVVSAEWPGRIGRIPRGENGFGYDPLFVVPKLNKTAAELTGAEKNAISHRGQAMTKLAALWQGWLEGETK